VAHFLAANQQPLLPPSRIHILKRGKGIGVKIGCTSTWKREMGKRLGGEEGVAPVAAFGGAGREVKESANIDDNSTEPVAMGVGTASAVAGHDRRSP
jgi:hypothetical protein